MTSFNYKGRTVDIKREEESGSGFYYSVIDGSDRSSLQATENIAAACAMKQIDAEEDVSKEDHSLAALCTIIRARVAEHAGNLSTEEALHLGVSLESSVQEFVDNWGGEHMTNDEWADEYLAANAEYQQDLQ